MAWALWPVIVGALLVLMALGATVMQRLPLSTGMLYLAVGFGLGPVGLGLLTPSVQAHGVLLEHLVEGVVLLSLFTSGLKLGTGLRDQRWRVPVRLAVVAMVVTVGLIALAAHWLLGLPPGAAVLLGAILAPTDPVLASEVQLQHPDDRDRLRFALTGEGGLNDGTAFPFVMLGLGWLGLHTLGAHHWRWWTVDVLWASVGGLLIGTAWGVAVGRLVLSLRRLHREAAGLDDFLALGLIGLAYGSALLAHAYGFLAVFAAGAALRQQEGRHLREPGAAGPLARAVLGFNVQAERIGEVAAVLTIGAMLSQVPWAVLHGVFVALLLWVIRPLSVALALVGAEPSGPRRWLMGWFGIRGIGSMYYLLFALNHGLPDELAQTLMAVTLTAVSASIVLHGISVTPLMAVYERWRVQRGRGG